MSVSVCVCATHIYLTHVIVAFLSSVPTSTLSFQDLQTNLACEPGFAEQFHVTLSLLKTATTEVIPLVLLWCTHTFSSFAWFTVHNYIVYD